MSSQKGSLTQDRSGGQKPVSSGTSTRAPTLPTYLLLCCLLSVQSLLQSLQLSCEGRTDSQATLMALFLVPTLQ